MIFQMFLVIIRQNYCKLLNFPRTNTFFLPPTPSNPYPYKRKQQQTTNNNPGNHKETSREKTKFIYINSGSMF